MTLLWEIIAQWVWNKVKPYSGWIAGIAGIIVAVAAIYFRGKSDQSKDAQIKTKQEVINAYKEHTKIATTINGASSADVDSMLTPWTRKE